MPIRDHPSRVDGAVGTRRARFPRSRISGRRGRHPAVPLRPRHGYAVDLHRDLPGQPSRTSREFPDHPQPAETTGYAPPTSPNPPDLELAIHEEASDVGSSRMPSRLAHRGPALPAVPNRPGFVAAAPTLPTVPWIRLPPALPGHYDGQGIEGLPPPTGKRAPRGARGVGLRRGADFAVSPFPQAARPNRACDSSPHTALRVSTRSERTVRRYCHPDPPRRQPPPRQRRNKQPTSGAVRGVEEVGGGGTKAVLGKYCSMVLRSARSRS